LELVERVLPAEELTSWQGVFLTSTSTKVMPLSAIDGRSVTLSPLVTQIRHAYDAFLKSYQAGQISDAEIL
jgi:branched-subunit amino acid aminotransferase/4-amino-4-deoxychorismate lyase